MSVNAHHATGGDAGNYWAIHPACVDSFQRGDYRRRQARRRAVASKTTRPASPPRAASESSDTVQPDTSSADAAEYTTMGQVADQF